MTVSLCAAATADEVLDVFTSFSNANPPLSTPTEAAGAVRLAARPRSEPLGHRRCLLPLLNHATQGGGLGAAQEVERESRPVHAAVYSWD